MKKIFFPAILLVLLACNETESDDNLGAVKPVGDTSTTNADNLDYAYSKTSTANYEIGRSGTGTNGLNSLKAYETNNMDAIVNNFGDTVELNFDNYHAKVSRDSAKAILTQNRAQYDSFRINMHDWETVKSTNTEDEYVSLWYTEIYKMKNGKLDSINIMDDVKVKDGKIIEINGYVRRFPAKNNHTIILANGWLKFS